MTVTDEMLSAFLDGELGTSQTDEVRAALDNDPALRARLNQFRQADRSMRQATSKAADRRLPQSVMALMAGDRYAANDLEGHRRHRGDGGRFRPTAMAASIALVVGLTTGALYQGALLGDPPYGTPAIAARIVPGEPLFAALETSPSGATVDLEDVASKVQPVLSFASVSGEPCRELEFTNPNDVVRAVACREQNAWRIDFAVRTKKVRSNVGYQTASASDDRLVSSYVSDVMNGDAFGRETEAMLITNEWRR